MQKSNIKKALRFLMALRKTMSFYEKKTYLTGVKNMIYHLEKGDNSSLKNALTSWRNLHTAGADLSSFCIYPENNEADKRANDEIDECMEYLDQFFDELFNELRVIGTY